MGVNVYNVALLISNVVRIPLYGNLGLAKS